MCLIVSSLKAGSVVMTGTPYIYIYIYMSFCYRDGCSNVLLLVRMLLELCWGAARSGTTMFRMIVLGSMWLGGDMV